MTADPQASDDLTVEVDSVGPSEWNRLLGRFADSTYDQTAAEAQDRWGSKRFSRLLLRRAGEAVAGAQVLILTVPPLSKGVAYVRFGPFWRRAGETPDPSVYRWTLSALVAEYCRRRRHALTILPRPSRDYLDLEADMLRACGFRQRRTMSDPNRYLVNLELSPAERLRSLGKTWRYNLQQALQGGTACRISEDPRDFADFADLSASMQSRKGFRESASVRLLAESADDLPPSMRPRLMLAEHDGRMVAGAVVGVLGDTAYYVFGASSETGLRLNAGYTLQWWIVNWLADGGAGARWYDLGGEVQQPGLRRFKKGLAGKAGAIVAMPGELDYWTDPTARTLADCIYGVRALNRWIRSR